MAAMRIRSVWLIVLLVLASCEQARRYTEEQPKQQKFKKVPFPPAAEKPPLPSIWTWLPPDETPYDVPIVFVTSSSPQWAELREFWNADPPLAGGTRTVHLALPPLQSAAAYIAAEQMQVFRIKVPLGLPDPNPHIPPANQPTYAKWRLGKLLFFEKLLRSGNDSYSCATCHQPEHGFCESRGRTFHGDLNTPGLINVVYNQRQFWDGRVAALEEVVVTSLDDERPAEEAPGRTMPEVSHRWGGIVRQLAADPRYQLEFRKIFGIAQPTQDAIAKALATYLRTLLSGDSLYDRAEARRREAKAKTLAAEHFLPSLDDVTLKALGVKLTKEEAARRLAHGHQLFHGKANCAGCHKGPLFTDHDFHNIGLIREDFRAPGRVAVAPIGLKEDRLEGAYRTPTLRALPRTAPYLHDGKKYTLESVIEFYDHEILPSRYLAAPLGNRDHAQKLHLDREEIDALVLFLQALDGTPLDPMVMK
jgi:cytochrome c peroxidase